MTRKKFQVLGLCLFVLAILFCGCGDDDDDSSSDAMPDDDDDSADDDSTDDDSTDDDTGDDDSGDDDTGDDDTVEPLDFPPYLRERPALTDWSSWRQVFDHSAPYHSRRIGGFGLGNGRVFAMVACDTPFNTLRNINGPNYQRNTKFFADKRFWLLRDGEPLAWDREIAYRVRGSDIIVVRQDAGDLSLWTVDVAPRGELVDDTDLQYALLRLIVVHNRGLETIGGLTLKTDTTMGGVDGDLLREASPDNLDPGAPLRKLVAGFADGSTPTKGPALLLPLADLAPDGEYVGEYAMAFALDDDPLPIFNALLAADPDELIDSTLADWRAFTAAATQITSSSERFDDLVEGMSYTVRVQTTDRGAVSQMSEYTGTWARDIMGPARLYPLIGRSADFLKMLDFYWLGAVERGNIANSIGLDEQFTPGHPQPDWENLPVMGGRTAAEGPSYVILHYKYYFDATGDWAPLEERYGMLRHSLIHQQLRETCLLPFSGDETFRIAMAAAFGQWFYDEYADTDLSANSSFLFVAAAEFLVRVATHLGYTDHVQQYEDLAALVRDCAEQYYWLEDEGHYSPIVDIDTLEPDPRPFEDVNTKPLWTGYLTPDDEQAKENIVNMMAKIGRDDGLMYTMIDPFYNWLKWLLDIEEAAITGMNYGYVLDSLAQIDHPTAETAFLTFAEFFHESGNVSEGMVTDDFGRAMYLTEPFGIVSDLTARFRSWEGPIDVAAQIQYLFGLQPDAVNDRVFIAPHLPADWTFAAMEDIRLGEASFDLTVEDDGAVRTITLNNATGTIAVDAQVSLAGDIAAVRVNGATVTPTIQQEWGRSRARLSSLSVSSTEPLIIEVVRPSARAH
ncbi:MAG TPA: hypothetical protein PKW95_11745 [bacterium]|nr:hypothetical protein [bacterium]